MSIPELGTIEALQIPLVFLTSNNTRELSEALKRRCLYLHVDYPTLEREKEIVLAKVPGVSGQPGRPDRPRRALDPPARPEEGAERVGDIDWARTLLLLNLDSIDEKAAKETLHTSSSTRPTSPRRRRN